MISILAAVVCVTVAIGGVRAQNGQDPKAELEAMKKRLQQLEEKAKQQQELIDKLLRAQGIPPGAPTQEPPQGKEEQEQEAQEKQQELEERLKDDILREIQPQLSAANKTFPSQFNPSIGLILDSDFSWRQNEGSNFDFRTAELGVAASVDPFARGYAIINASSDGVEVEEAAIVTTSLPYNLTAKGGRFFADFGRLSKFHDHELPFVNRPLVLENFVGGESKADGLEVDWLAPTDQYLTLTFGAYNKIGAENDRVDNGTPRNLSQFTYLARVSTYFELNDAESIDIGLNYAYTPRVDSYVDAEGIQLREGNQRGLADLDITYRYIPPGEAQYQGLIWGTEILNNYEHWNIGSLATPDIRSRSAWGMYSYMEAKLSQRYRPGFLFDFSQDLARETSATTCYSPYLTIWISEFNRLRFQYTYLDEPGNQESQFFIQWTAVLGSHVHGFRHR